MEYKKSFQLFEMAWDYKLDFLDKNEYEEWMKKLSTLYKKKALLWHPDKNPSCLDLAESKMKEYNCHYQLLQDYLFHLLHKDPIDKNPIDKDSMNNNSMVVKSKPFYRRYEFKEKKSEETKLEETKLEKNVSNPISVYGESIIYKKIDKEKEYILKVKPKIVENEKNLIVTIKLSIMYVFKGNLVGFKYSNLITKPFLELIAKAWFGFKDIKVKTIERMLDVNYFWNIITYQCINNCEKRFVKEELVWYFEKRKMNIIFLLQKTINSTLLWEYKIVENTLEHLYKYEI